MIKRKDYIKVLILLGVMTIAMPLVFFLKAYMSGFGARSLGKPQECTAISIQSVSKGRTSEYVTTFVTESGTQVEAATTNKDYVGRKTTLLVYEKEGARQEFELPKITMIYYVMIGLIVVCWGSFLYYRITKKFTVIKE